MEPKRMTKKKTAAKPKPSAESWMLERRSHHVLIISLVFAIVVLTIMLWSGERGQEAHLHIQNAGDLPVLLPSIVGLTESSLDRGNRVEVLENGDNFFPPLLRDIAAAQRSVNVESYIWWKGDICNQLAAALAAKARQGVEVRLLVDALGGHKMDSALYSQMVAAGVHVTKFHPVRFTTLGRLNNRDHRKIAVIDGRVGYIGGFGVAKEWTGHGQDRQHFRDTGLRLEGPIVNSMQGAFCENWTESTGELLAGEKQFPIIPAAGSISAHLAYTSPTGSLSAVQILYYLAISAARREILIQNPYMLPDDDAVEAMSKAVKRGVVVRIMVPATSSTDSPIVQHASHHLFGSLLRAGVHVYEFKRTLLHQKVIIVDGVWSGVGSANFDDRSFQRNDEISVGVIDPGIAAQLKAAFEDDLRACEERHLDEWKRRPLWHKAIDGLAYAANPEM
jgi:cardiolipin synthase